MALSFTQILSENSTALSSVFVTSTYAMTSGRMYLFAIWNRTNVNAITTVTLVGNGATWVTVLNQSATFGRSGVSLLRARPSAPIPAASTFTFPGARVACGWTVYEVQGDDTSSTDGAAAIAQAVGANGANGTTALSIGLAPFGNTANVGLGFFALNTSVVLTTGSGFSPMVSTFAGTLGWLQESAVNTTAVSARNGGSTTFNLTGIAIEVVTNPIAPPQELSGSISVPVTVSGDAPVSHNLGATINAATTATATIQESGHLLAGAIAVPTSVSQSVGITHFLAIGAITASVLVEGDAKVTGQDIFSRTAQDFQLEGELIIRAKARERLRKLINPSSPNFTRSFAVSTDATQAIDLLPLQNARFSMLLPGSTNIHPYRVAPTATAANTNGALLFSGRNPSLVALGIETTALHIFTSVSTVLPLRVKLL